MTSELHRPGLHPFSHLKAGPTTSSSRSTARPSSTTQPYPHSSSRPRLSKNNHTSREDQIDAVNDKATTTLIRRVLCPQANSSSSLEELLPPLTSSNDVDRQLYALIAIIVKEFVYSWYSKFTSDQILVNELLQVIAHCTRALEQRLRQVDVAQLVLDDIPALFEAHITSYRLAKQQSTLSGLHTSTRTIYHTLNSHPALSPIPDSSQPESLALQCEHESIYRQLLVHGTLAVLLPTEDLENTCLRTLISDIVADLILGKEVSGRVCEGWFLWETIAKLVEISRKKPDQDSGKKAPEDRLKKFGLLATDEEEEAQSRWGAKSQSRVSVWIWSLLQYVYVTFVALRFIATGLFRVASNTPANPPRTSKATPLKANILINQCPVLDYRLFSMVSELLDMSRRMPWLGGLLALLQHLTLAGPGKLGDADSVLDRFLHENIQDYVLTPTLLPHLLLALRTALFPLNNNVSAAQAAGAHRAAQTPAPHVSAHPPASPQVEGGSSPHASASLTRSSTSSDNGDHSKSATRPSAPEIAATRRQCAASLLTLIPRSIARRFLGADAAGASRRNRNGHDHCVPIDNHNSNNDQFNGSTNGPSTINDNPNTSNDSQRQQKLPQTAQPPSRGSSPSPSPSTQSPFPSQTPPPNAGQDEEEFLLTAIENEFLDLLEDEYCNKHLVYSILETVLGKLLPELGERSIGTLLEDRGVLLSAAVSSGK